MRVPTWLPCRLQIYCNGHNWLAAQLRKRDIPYELRDNAFLAIGDWQQAQRIADEWGVKQIHFRLDEFAQRFCPIFRDLAAGYHWSLYQTEYPTDIVFHRQADLAASYEALARTAIHSVKPGNRANRRAFEAADPAAWRKPGLRTTEARKQVAGRRPTHSRIP